jgi:Tol biopolymer transport system component
MWAVDPARPADRGAQVLLSSKADTPKGWSPDGSKLLVLRDLSDAVHPDEWVLFVLNADGTETRLAQASSRGGAGFTPDGAKVVYSGSSSSGASVDEDIHVISAEGGTPELLLANGPLWWTLSPDGTQIAYLDWGGGDHSHSLRVMNTDGTGMRVATEDPRIMGGGHLRGPAVGWSPDGQHIAFATEYAGVWVVGIDGSGLEELASAAFVASDLHWSPDGSFISFDYGPQLVIARPDGTRVATSNEARSGPWNPATPR